MGTDGDGRRRTENVREQILRNIPLAQRDESVDRLGKRDPRVEKMEVFSPQEKRTETTRWTNGQILYLCLKDDRRIRTQETTNEKTTSSETKKKKKTNQNVPILHQAYRIKDICPQ